jgi:large subunit ribosomal protein L23
MNAERLFMVVDAPYTSEKSTVMADKFKQITFSVLKNATKAEIKTAIEQLFDVKVRAVNIMNVNGKAKKFRQLPGKRKDWKKAYVSLQEGYDISFA